MMSIMLEGKEELAAYKTEKILELKKVKIVFIV
jgi:hypothetical protein